MSKLLRTILKIFGAAAALLVVLVVVVLFLVDPDQFRPTLEEAVYDTTGLQLNIAGEMSLSYRPYVGVTLEDVRLRNPDRPQELLSASTVALRVDPRDLLSGRLTIEEVHAEDFHFNWYVDQEGNSWWMTDQLARSSESDNVSTTGEDDTVTTRLNFITVSNGSADLQNLQQGYYYSVRDLELSSQNSNAVGRPFPLQASFELIDPSAPAPWPVTLSSNNRIAFDEGNIELADIQLALTPALFQGSLSITNLFDEYDWRAQFTTNEFALDDLLDNLLARQRQASGSGIPGLRTDEAWQSRLQGQVAGDTGGIEMPELVFELGDLRLEAEAAMRFSNGLLPTNLRFTVDTNNLDLSPYLAARQSEPPPTQASNSLTIEEASENWTPLDLQVPDSLRSDMNVQGSVNIDSLFVSGVQFGIVNLFANVESGVLDVELQPTNVLNGSVAGNVRINSVPSRSEVTVELSTEQLDMADLTLPFLVPGAISGRLDLESRFSGTGNTLGEWLDSFGGASSFVVADNAVDIGIIKQVFTAIAAFSPTGEAIQQWPDVIRFNEFNGYALFEDGLDNNQQIKVQLDNFDIAGNGGIDLDTAGFDYDLLFTVSGLPLLQTIPINESYHGVSWPVRCNARFDDPVNQYCRPDLAQVREIFSQLSNDVAPQADNEDAAAEPVQQFPQESPRDFFRRLFQNN